MNKTYVKIITGMALVALLSVQGIWVHNTYTFLHKKLVTELEEEFARSIEEEIHLRLQESSDKIPKGQVVYGASPFNDFYANSLAFHEYLLSAGFPFSLEKLDSIWAKKTTDKIGRFNYILIKTDAARNITEQISRSKSEKSSKSLTIERPIRKDNSEYLWVIIVSPHSIVIQNMLLLLTASLINVLLLIYCLFLQIWMLFKQERIAEIRNDFTNALIHDMDTPISNILMTATTLKKGKLDNMKQIKNRYFDIILREANRLLAFTHKILTIAQLQHTKIELSKRAIDLNGLIGSLTEEYPSTNSKDIQFVINLENQIVLYADPVYMDDVFRNLIENAIKYSNKTVTIEITAKSAAQHTIISIRDNGFGIKRKDRKRIFKRYERTRSNGNEKKGGFGLGLYYVSQVVLAHGGKVDVASMKGVFSEFTILIPTKGV